MPTGFLIMVLNVFALPACAHPLSQKFQLPVPEDFLISNATVEMIVVCSAMVPWEPPPFSCHGNLLLWQFLGEETPNNWL